jgi:hypothetical protein
LRTRSVLADLSQCPGRAKLAFRKRIGGERELLSSSTRNANVGFTQEVTRSSRRPAPLESRRALRSGSRARQSLEALLDVVDATTEDGGAFVTLLHAQRAASSTSCCSSRKTSAGLHRHGLEGWRFTGPTKLAWRILAAMDGVGLFQLRLDQASRLGHFAAHRLRGSDSRSAKRQF